MQDAIAGLDFVCGHRGCDEIYERAMLDGDTFGIAGRTRGVNYVGEIPRRDLNRQVVPAFPRDDLRVAIDGNQPGATCRNVFNQTILGQQQR